MTTSLTNIATSAAAMPVDNGGFLPPNVIHASNESRFAESFYSEPLTTYTAGWRDPSGVEQTLNFIAPAVEVNRRFEYKTHNNAEAFLSETDDLRAAHASFKTVEYTGDSVMEKTHNKGLTIVVDLDNVPAASADWRNLYTGRLLQRLYRNDLRRAVDALAAAAVNTAKTWDTTTGKDPDMDVIAELVTATDATGVRPNRVLFGDTAWQKRALSHRAQNNAGAYGSAALSPEAVAALLGVEGVHVSRERWQSGASSKSQIVNNLVLMFYALDNATTEDASHIKRFVSPTLAGTRTRVYEQQLDAKRIALTVEHYSHIVVTSSIGIRKFTVS
ncbi:hypothetical protein DB346_07500 [Verrucomicrobia bacterium LW23]|nr:hypothetical protein DB346_07500 [Verrucomicrobia bacterium LW23]